MIVVSAALLAFGVVALPAQAAQTPVVNTIVTAQGALGVLVNPVFSVDDDPPVSFTFDWGDGTPTTTEGSVGGTHVYRQLGTYTITTTMTDSAGQSVSKQDTFTTDGARFVAFGPKRLLDTRNGTGRAGVIGQVRGGGTVPLQVAGVNGIPPAARAVALTVTVARPQAAGNVAAYPAGTTPKVSTVNFVKGQTVPNATVVPVGAGGVVNLTVAGGPVDLVVDVTGYFVGDDAADGYTTMTSTRVLDTRSGLGVGGRKAPVAAHATVGLQMAGVAGIPAAGVTAVAVNLTVTGPSAGGVITAYPGGTVRPVASNVNFVAGQTVANLAIVPVGADGRIELANVSPGRTNLVADVLGYFTRGRGNTFVPVTPLRAFDTRPGGPIPARSQSLGSSQLLVARTAGVVMNVTVTNTHAGGFVLAGPRPLPAGLAQRASTVNWSGAGRTVANLSIPNSTDGIFTIVNESDGATDVIGDVSGYFEPAGAIPPSAATR